MDVLAEDHPQSVGHVFYRMTEAVIEQPIIIVYPDREPRQTEPEPGSHWRYMARRCLGHKGDLKPAECRFLRDIISWRGEPTPRQRAWLQAIAEALGIERVTAA